MPSATSPGEEFWDFSSAVYRRPGVAAQLLLWQDQAGANVNIALLCLWASTRGQRLDAAAFLQAKSAIAGWHAAAVEPLRGLRRRLKDQWAGLALDATATRQAVLAAELAAERAEQQLLVDSLAPWPDSCAADYQGLAAANLRGYLAGAVDDKAIAELLCRIG